MSFINEILQATDLKDGMEIIKTQEPSLVFLDIEMPQESGLNILKYFVGQPILFKIIFTTAHNQYAIHAFKTSAIDYLLNSIDADELIAAVNKAKNSIEQPYT